jgi:hypothetical protein
MLAEIFMLRCGRGTKGSERTRCERSGRALALCTSSTSRDHGTKACDSLEQVFARCALPLGREGSGGTDASTCAHRGGPRRCGARAGTVQRKRLMKS